MSYKTSFGFGVGDKSRSLTAKGQKAFKIKSWTPAQFATFALTLHEIWILPFFTTTRSARHKVRGQRVVIKGGMVEGRLKSEL